MPRSKRDSVELAPAGPSSQCTGLQSGAAGQRWTIETLHVRAREFTRYLGASVAAVVLDTVVFLALVWLNVMSAPLAGGVGYGCGLILSYAICVTYIFDVESTGKSNRRLMAEFGASGLLGIILTYVMIALLVDVCAVPPLAAKVVTVGVVFVAIYVVRSAKIFAPQTSH